MATATTPRRAWRHTASVLALVTGNTRRIAEALDWPYWSDRLHVVSRYPLIDPPAAHGEYAELAHSSFTVVPR